MASAQYYAGYGYGAYPAYTGYGYTCKFITQFYFPHIFAILFDFNH